MAATSLDQDRLKAQAGVKNTGRKSKDHVLHLTLSWHPDEAEALSRAEMLRAADGALRALDAGDRQVLFVSHNDEPQPHLHIMINRVSPEDGRVLSSSKEKLALSRWAEAYEKARGQVFCEERVLNNAARDRGEYTRGKKDQARHIFELEAANDNPVDGKKIREEQRRQDGLLAKRRRDLVDRHARQWQEFQGAHKQRISDIQAETPREIARQVDAIRNDYRPAWAALHRKHQAELQAFEARETKLLGRLQNAVKLIDFRGLIGRGRPDADEGKAQGIGETFKAVSSAGAREQELRRQQEAQRQALEAEQRVREREAREVCRSVEVKRLAQNRQRCEMERMQLILTQAMDRAKTRAEQLSRTRQRRAAWSKAPPEKAMDEDRHVRSPEATAREDGQKTPAEKRLERKRRRRTRSRDEDELGR
jgi:hypothetical protein